MAEKFNFQGFEPSSELLSITKDILWKIEGEAPSKACSTAMLSKVGNDYNGTIKVSSLSGVFTAESTGAKPEAVVQELYNRIHSKLVTWKDSRFLNDIKE